MTWATPLGILLVGVSYYRMLRVVYVDGQLDEQARRIIRSASLIPVFSLVAALLLTLGAMWLFPGAVAALTWVTLVLVVAGGIWSLERGIAAVRVARER